MTWFSLLTLIQCSTKIFHLAFGLYCVHAHTRTVSEPSEGTIVVAVRETNMDSSFQPFFQNALSVHFF